MEFNVGAANLYPGGPSQPISFSVTNPGSTSAEVGTVTIGVAEDSTGDANNGAVESVAGDASTAVAGCAAAWFTLGVSSVPVGPEIPPGGSVEVVGQSSISMPTSRPTKTLVKARPSA